MKNYCLSDNLFDESTLKRLEGIEWINIKQLNEFREQSTSKEGIENKKMLFEMVDLTFLWVKSRKVYNILETITNLEQRIEWNDWKIEYSNDSNEKLICLLTWLSGNIYSYDKEQKVFYHKRKWHFFKDNTSILEPSEGDQYIWFPFIIGWTDLTEDFPLLQLISWITEEHLRSLDSKAITHDISWIIFWEKQIVTERWIKKKTPCIRASITTKLWWTGLWDVYKEVPIELREQAVLFEWLPDFLVNSNKSFLAFIKNPISKLEKAWILNNNQLGNLRQKVIDNQKNPNFWVDTFRLWQLIKHVITSDLMTRVYLENWAKTEAWFIHDTEIFQRFIESSHFNIKQFLINPFKENWE